MSKKEEEKGWKKELKELREELHKCYENNVCIDIKRAERIAKRLTEIQKENDPYVVY